MLDLKPCPFCGNSDIEVEGLGIDCRECHAGFYVDPGADPTAAWNRRALSASIPAEIGELVERLEDRTKVSQRWEDEAASALRALSVRNGELSAELETVKEKWNSQLVETQRAWNERDGEKRTRLAAEAKLAGGEAVKVLPLPDDLFSHRDAWRKALVLARDTAEVQEPDIDDYSYWQHELDVFDKVYEALTHPAHTHNDGSGEKVSDEWFNPSNAVFKKSASGKPASHTSGEVTEADLKRAYLMGREQWCPAGILSDTARTERDWQRARAALRGDAS